MLLSPLTFVALICISNWRDLAPKPFRCFNEPRCIARSWSAFSVGRVVTDKSEQWRQVYLLRSSSEYEEPCWHVCHLGIGFFCSWSESRISISVISIHLGWEFFLCINIEVMYKFYVHKFQSCICVPRTLDILHAYAQPPPPQKKTNSSITFSAVCVCCVCVQCASFQDCSDTLKDGQLLFEIPIIFFSLFLYGPNIYTLSSQLLVDPDILWKLKTMKQIWGLLSLLRAWGGVSSWHLKVEPFNYHCVIQILTLTLNRLNVSAWYDTGSSQSKTSLLPVIPTAIWPLYPQSLPPWPDLHPPPPPPPATAAAPPCAASPQEPCCPLIWSDTATYSRRRCSQGRPSHPRAPVVHNPLSLCSYGSVTIEPSHMGAPLHCMLNPQRSQRSWQHAHRQDWWFFGGPPGGWVSTWRQTKKSAQLLSVVSL